MKRSSLLSLLLVIPLSITIAQADTYTDHTLVKLIHLTQAQKQVLLSGHIDVVDAGPGWAKALLTAEEMKRFQSGHWEMEILTNEMERDRALWSRATGYYTASTFNTTNPPTGSLMEHLLNLHNAHPDITRLYDIGDSADGNYDIIAMKVTDNPDVEEPEPEIRIYATIHGDEKSAMMVACDALDWILGNYATDPDAQKLVNDSEMWFIPLGNPWGCANNSRYNANGIDLNRNFWGPAGCTESPCFSQPETQAIRDLTEVTGKIFVTSLSFHSGATLFNSVYNYTHTATSDEPIFFSARTGGINGGAVPSLDGLAEAYQNGCTMPGFWFTNGADWYITYGDTNDWSYAAWSDLDTTLEVTSTKTPPSSEIATYTAQHRQGVINYMLKTFQGISGLMTDSITGSPLDGQVAVTCTDSTWVPVPHDYRAVLTDPDVGDFHRVLEPGTYTVTCTSSGYDDVTIPGVVVTADTTTTVDCPMVPTAVACDADLGDVNLNGSVTSYDASLVLQIVVGLITPDAGQSCRADVNEGGSVTSYDASLILQCVVGMCGSNLPGTFLTSCQTHGNCQGPTLRSLKEIKRE